MNHGQLEQDCHHQVCNLSYLDRLLCRVEDQANNVRKVQPKRDKRNAKSDCGHLALPHRLLDHEELLDLDSHHEATCDVEGQLDAQIEGGQVRCVKNVPAIEGADLSPIQNAYDHSCGEAKKQ